MEDRYVAYVGSYTRGESKGIYIMDLDPVSGGLSIRDTYKINNPSHHTISYDGRFLYSVFDGGAASFRILEDGGLELMNTASVNGLRPASLCVDRANRFLVSGGYHDGKVTVVKLLKNGKVGEVTDEIFMKGLGSVGAHHYHSHINCVLFTPDEKYVAVVDLGMDQVQIFAFDHETGKLRRQHILRCELDSGPRYMVFSNSGQYAYLLHEYGNYVQQYAYDPETAAFTEMGQLSTLPEDYNGYNSSINLEISDDDRHLFSTNSGNNSVAVFEINPDDGQMRRVCVLPVSGEFPNDVGILPDGERFISVNQEGNSLTSFRANYEQGYFVMAGRPLSIPSPTCICIHKL